MLQVNNIKGRSISEKGSNESVCGGRGGWGIHEDAESCWLG